MWKDVVRTYGSKEIVTSILKIEHKDLKGPKTKYTVEIYPDDFSLRLHDKVVYCVKCSAAGLKTTKLKSENIESAKKEALSLIKNKLEKDIASLNSFYSIVGDLTKKGV